MRFVVGDGRLPSRFAKSKVRLEVAARSHVLTHHTHPIPCNRRIGYYIQVYTWIFKHESNALD